MQSESSISVVEKGLVNAIGVNNFSVKQIEELLTFAKIVPAVNQVLDFLFFPSLFMEIFA